MRRGDDEQIEIGRSLGVEVSEAARERDHPDERHAGDERQDAAIAIEQLSAERLAPRSGAHEIGSAGREVETIALFERGLQQIALAAPRLDRRGIGADADQARFELRQRQRIVEQRRADPERRTASSCSRVGIIVVLHEGSARWFDRRFCPRVQYGGPKTRDNRR